jgi:hypothetical protein
MNTTAKEVFSRCDARDLLNSIKRHEEFLTDVGWDRPEDSLVFLLASRVEKVLALLDEIVPPGLGLHPDDPDCALCQVRVALERILNGEEE